MNRLEKIRELRNVLASGKHSIGSWMQIPHASVAEVMGQAGYQWVAVDLEHGTISHYQLPDIFRALELGGVLPLARVAEGSCKDCKQALDAGAGGVIVPMVETASQLINIRESCYWPPAGTRGVGFSRANLFGKHFEMYVEEAQAPFLVAQIEHIRSVNNLEEILKVPGLDAIMIGPYDLSASMNLTRQFEHPEFIKTIHYISKVSSEHEIPCGIHIVMPDKNELETRIAEGYQFIAYSIDAVFLYSACSLEK